MPTEIFRLLNIRPPRPAVVVAVDDVAGVPPLMRVLQLHADRRELTRERLTAAVEGVPAVDGATLQGLAVTRLGRQLASWRPGDAVEPIVAAAGEIALDDPQLRQTLEAAGDVWLAKTLAANVLGDGASVPGSLTDVTRSLKGAALARSLRTLPAGADVSDVIASVARAPVAVRDPVGVISALRSSGRPEEIDERRNVALTRAGRAPDPAARYALAERLQRKLLDAHAEIGSQKRAQLRGQNPGALMLPAPASDAGVLGRLRTWLFGEPGAGRSATVVAADAISSAGAGAALDRRLDDEERALAREVLGPGYLATSENLEASLGALQQFQAAALEAAQATPLDSLTRPAPGTIIDEIPPMYVPGFRPGVRIAGIGDLIVARESHKRYEAEEIAHIENVLPLEERVRQHRKVRATESIFEQETQQETETEEDLRTSDRYELQSESERTIETQFSVDFGLNVTANYGFVNGSITVDADLGINYSRNVTESERTATSFSNEVVTRSLERIQQRARELRRVTLTETIDELNRHAISGLLVPFSGIYKWVNKVQEVELRHYGQRLMLEFYVPEPALRLLRSVKQQEIDVPPTIDFDPETTDITNYMARARTFEASGVGPPPPYHVTVEAAFAHQPRPPEDNQSKYWSHAEAVESIPLPNGYAPTSASAIVLASQAQDSINATVAVAGRLILSGTFQSGFNSGLVQLGTSNPRNEKGVAVAYSLYDYARLRGLDTGAVHISIHCHRTVEAWQAWQLDVFQKCFEGNQRQLAAYREALLSQAATSGVQISGRNPLENRIIERDELKRWSIELMRGRPFDINSIDETGPVPNAALDRLDGNRNINLFFEKAFEWTQMTYWLYPYFWGRREQWGERLGLQDPDPLHQQFLRAGSARVLVPVTPGYEERVLYYLNTAGWEDQRVIWTPDADAQATNPLASVPALAPNPDIWMEVILNKNKELAYGTGTLTVTSGSADVTVNADSSWDLDQTDVGRELFIEGFRYSLAAVAGRRNLSLDRPYDQNDNAAAHYLVSSIRIGAPWEVVIPTNLVVLADQASKLNLSAGVNVIAPADVMTRPAPAPE
jgi:hypothetical protein